MPKLIHAVYQPKVGWAHPILSALNSKQKLAEKHSEWASSKLSDLAFSIETRSGVLPGIARQIAQAAEILKEELANATKAGHLQHHIDKGSFHFQHEIELRSAVSEAVHLLAEERALFYNLADFNREFLRHYFEEGLSKEESYDYLRSLSKDSGRWVDRLRELRNDVLHDRSPWLAFSVSSTTPLEAEPLFHLNWRPSSVSAASQDVFSLSELYELHQALDECGQLLRKELIARVESL